MRKLILLLLALYSYSNILGQGPEIVKKLTHTPGDLNVTVWNDGFFGPHHEPGLPGSVSWKGINGVFGSSICYGTEEVGKLNGIAGVGIYFNDMVNISSNFGAGFTQVNAGTITFDQATTAIIRDDNAPQADRFGFDVIQKTYSTTGNDVVFCRNGYVNNTDSVISNLYSAFGSDIEIGNKNSNHGGVDESNNLVYVYEHETNNPFFGIVALSGITGCEVGTTLYGSINEERIALFNRAKTINSSSPPMGDQVVTIGSVIHNVAIGDTAWVTFAIVAGDDLEDLISNAEKAYEIAVNTGWQDIVVGVEEALTSDTVPNKFSLTQNYPNPFNPTTSIKYSIPIVEFGFVPTTHLAIFDVLGQEVEVLINKKQNPGNYEVTWDANNHTSGVYICKLQVGSFVETRKMILIK